MLFSLKKKDMIGKSMHHLFIFYFETTRSFLMEIVHVLPAAESFWFSYLSVEYEDHFYPFQQSHTVYGMSTKRPHPYGKRHRISPLFDVPSFTKVKVHIYSHPQWWKKCSKL
jgi:hypothetical protein